MSEKRIREATEDKPKEKQEIGPPRPSKIAKEESSDEEQERKPKKQTIIPKQQQQQPPPTSGAAFSRIRKGKLSFKGEKSKKSDKDEQQHNSSEASDLLDKRCKEKADRHCN